MYYRQLRFFQEHLPEITRALKDRVILGVCANKYCETKFIFQGSFVLEKMIAHVGECLRREEKRGSFKWIEHYCESCQKRFFWDLDISLDSKKGFNFVLITMKAYGSSYRLSRIEKNVI